MIFMQNNRREIKLPEEKPASGDSNKNGEKRPKEEDVAKKENDDEVEDDEGNWKRRKVASASDKDGEESEFPPDSELIADFADGEEEQENSKSESE